MSREDFEAVAQNAKEQHRKRVSENSARLAYALERIKVAGFVPSKINNETAQIVVRLGKKAFVFYAGTGTIQGCDIRGIKNFIGILILNKEVLNG